MRQRSKLSVVQGGRTKKKPPPGFADDGSNDAEVEAPRVEETTASQAAPGGPPGSPQGTGSILAGLNSKKLIGLLTVAALSAVSVYLFRRWRR